MMTNGLGRLGELKPKPRMTLDDNEWPAYRVVEYCDGTFQPQRLRVRLDSRHYEDLGDRTDTLVSARHRIAELKRKHTIFAVHSDTPSPGGPV